MGQLVRKQLQGTWASIWTTWRWFLGNVYWSSTEHGFNKVIKLLLHSENTTARLIISLENCWTRKALWNNCHVFLSCRIHVAAWQLKHWSQQRHCLTWKGQHTQWRPRVFSFPSQLIYTALRILLFCCWFFIKNAKRGSTQEENTLWGGCALTLCKQHCKLHTKRKRSEGEQFGADWGNKLTGGPTSSLCFWVFEQVLLTRCNNLN